MLKVREPAVWLILTKTYFTKKLYGFLFSRNDEVRQLPKKILQTKRTMKYCNSLKVTLQGTNISATNGMFEDDFPFPVWWDMLQ